MPEDARIGGQFLEGRSPRAELRRRARALWPGAMRFATWRGFDEPRNVTGLGTRAPPSPAAGTTPRRSRSARSSPQIWGRIEAALSVIGRAFTLNPSSSPLYFGAHLRGLRGRGGAPHRLRRTRVSGEPLRPAVLSRSLTARSPSGSFNSAAMKRRLHAASGSLCNPLPSFSVVHAFCWPRRLPNLGAWLEEAKVVVSRVLALWNFPLAPAGFRAATPRLPPR